MFRRFPREFAGQSGSGTLAKSKRAEPKRKRFLNRHLHQHHRFYAGAIAAAGAFFGTDGEPWPVRVIAAGDAFFLVYLLLFGIFALRATPDTTMTHARVEDEGVTLIATLTLTAVGCSLTAIVLLMGEGQSLKSFPLAAAIISVPLGWLTVHSSVALHYARLYYAEEEDGGSQEGLQFPCDEAPDVLDFLYFSFVLGMSAQTSDVEITGRRMRRSVLLHSVVSFFYNTVILALTVNAAVQLAGD